MRNLLTCKKINNRLLSLIVVCFICLLCAFSFNYNVANAAKHQETDCEVEARAYVNRMIEVIRNTHAIVGYKTVTRSDTNQKEFQVLLKKNRITEQEIVLFTTEFDNKSLDSSEGFGVDCSNDSSAMLGYCFKVGAGGGIDAELVNCDLTRNWSNEVKHTMTKGYGFSVVYTFPNVQEKDLGEYSLLRKMTGHEYILVKFTLSSIKKFEAVTSGSGKNKKTSYKEVHDHYAYTYSGETRFFVAESQRFSWRKTK